MTAKTRSNLVTEFQTGDVPDGSDYQDLIDSALNLTDSSAQTMTSKLTISGGLETTNVTAQRVFCSAATFTGAVSAATLNATSAQTSFLQVSQTVSCSSVWVNGPASFNASASFSNAVGIGTAAPAEGLLIAVSGESNLRLNVVTTVAASVGVSGPATPASVAGFIPVVINGVKRMIAFYNAV
jgi:hypothetical protein